MSHIFQSLNALTLAIKSSNVPAVAARVAIKYLKGGDVTRGVDSYVVADILRQVPSLKGCTRDESLQAIDVCKPFIPVAHRAPRATGESKPRILSDGAYGLSRAMEASEVPSEGTHSSAIAQVISGLEFLAQSEGCSGFGQLVIPFSEGVVSNVRLELISLRGTKQIKGYEVLQGNAVSNTPMLASEMRDNKKSEIHDGRVYAIKAKIARKAKLSPSDVRLVAINLELFKVSELETVSNSVAAKALPAELKAIVKAISA